MFRKRRDAAIAKEVQAHIEMAVRDRIERGESPDAARRAVLREFGNVSLTIEDSRAVWSWTTLEQLFLDIRSGFRILTRAPGLSLSAVVLIALVIGGNTTIFSAASSIVNKPAPGVSPDGLVSPGWMSGDHGPEPELSHPDFLDLAAATRTVDLAAWHQAMLTLRLSSGVYSVHGELTSRNYFAVMGQAASRGRLFGSSARGSNDDERGGLTAVIGDRLWRTLFDAREDVVGSTVTLNGQAVTIIGIVSAPFHGPWTGQTSEIWLPLDHASSLYPQMRLADRNEKLLDGTAGRLRPGVSFAQAAAELGTLGQALPQPKPTTEQPGPRSLALYPYSGTAARAILVVQHMPMFMAIFSFITLSTLVIVCANVSNLMLARAMVRQREMAVRQSLGASRLRIVRVVLSEGFAIALFAWAGACLFAWWTSQLLPSLFPPSEGGGAPLVLDFTPDWLTVTYAMGLAFVGTLAFSLAPIMSTWRLDLLSFMKAGERGTGSRGLRTSRVLVAMQLTLAVVLLSGTTMAYRSLSLIDRTEVGFDPQGLMLATLDIRQAATDTDASAALLDRLSARLAAIPGVQGTSYVSVPPTWRWPGIAVREPKAPAPIQVERNDIGPAHLSLLGRSVIAGREFDGSSSDASGVVVTEALARRLWPNTQPIVGRTLLAGDPELPVTVIGVAPDAYYGGFRNSGMPEIAFMSARAAQADWVSFPTIYVRSRDTATLGLDIRRIVGEVDSRVPVVELRPIDTDLQDITWTSRSMTLLLSLFAAVSLVIAVVGQYAAMAFAAQRRTRELAIRLALGATANQVATEVLRSGLRLTTAGLVIGLAAGALAGRLAQGLLYGTGPADPMILASVVLILGAVSLIACVIPAWRASGVDPIETLRQE